MSRPIAEMVTCSRGILQGHTLYSIFDEPQWKYTGDTHLPGGKPEGHTLYGFPR